MAQVTIWTADSSVDRIIMCMAIDIELGSDDVQSISNFARIKTPYPSG